MSAAPRVTAVVVTWNRKALLLECLECLRRQTAKADILVVDNASTDGTGEALRPMIEAGEIAYVNTGKNLGGAGGFQFGVKAAVEAGCDYVWIMDDDSMPTPTALEALLSAARHALERGEIDSIRLSTRPDAIDGKTLDRLAAYGVETIELGAQSMDEGVLRLSCRGHSAADVERASRMIRARGFSLILQMMTGLPGDTEEKDLETARRLIALQPEGVRIYPTVIVRDTALEKLWERGAYREHTVEDAVRVCARLLPLFEEAGIPVIRLGLNPTEELSGGAALGGAYHPALGELVKSRILRNRAETLLAGTPPKSRVLLTVGRGKTSQMTGQHRENLRWLCNRFDLAEIRVRENAENPEYLSVSVEK